MNKTGKIVSIGAGLCLVLALVPVFFLLTFDLNQYKSLIVDVVKRQTGRELSLTGPMEKSLFPWLGIKVGAATLGNAPGFEQEVFAGVEEAQIKVQFWPLLQRRLVVDTVVLNGLQLHLRRNREGQSNFQDFLGSEPEDAADSKAVQTEKGVEKTIALSSFQFGGLDLRQASISWQDDQAGQRFDVTQLNVRTGEIVGTDPVDFEISMQLAATQLATTTDVKADAPPPISQSASVHMAGRLRAELERQQVSVDGWKISLGIAKGSLPIDIKEIKLSMDTALDVAQQKLTLNNLDIRTMGLKFSGNVQSEKQLNAKLLMSVVDTAGLQSSLQALLPDSEVPLSAEALAALTMSTELQLDLDKQTLSMPLVLTLAPMTINSQLDVTALQSKPQFKGRLHLAPFSPRTLMQRLGLKAPADEKILQNFTATLNYKGDLDAVSVKPMQVQLDKSKLSGQIQFKSTQGPQINYALQLNRIDLDQYFPPAPAQSTPVTATPSAAPAIENELPLDALRKLKINGSFDLGEAVVNRIKIRKLKTKLQADKGLFTVKPLSLQLYGGSITAQANLDVSGEKPQWSVNETLKNVRIGELLHDATQEDIVSGVANLTLALKGEGLSPDKDRDKLNGNVQFHFIQGQAKYLNLMDILLKDYAKYLKKAVPENEPTNATVFKELKGSAVISNGILTNKDMWLSSSPIEVKGQGTANLITEQLDFIMNTTIVKPTKGMKKIKLDELQGVPIPIKIYGSMFEPKHKIDFGAVLKSKANQALEKEKVKAKAKAKQSLEKEKAKVKEKLQEKSKKALDKLKNKFKF